MADLNVIDSTTVLWTDADPSAYAEAKSASPTGKFLRDDGTWQTGPGGDTGTKGDTGAAGGKGDTGDIGDTGVGFLWMNLWNPFQEFSVNDVVLWRIADGGDDNNYICISAGNQGVSPTDLGGDTYWQLFVPHGVAGDTGVTGDTGVAGNKGDTGAAGSKGDTGAIGSKGDTGVKGDTGAAADTTLLTGITSGRNEPTGFEDITDTSLAWNDAGPREFTLTKVNNFVIWTGGIKHSFTTSQSVTITDTKALHYIYCDTDGVLKSTTDLWDISGVQAPVATVYWNGTNGRCSDERHGIQMDGQTHEYLHETRGAAFASGGGLTAAADGSTFQVEEGEWYDDDLEYLPSTTTTAPILYRDASGSPTIWVWTTAGAKYYHTVSSVPQYDNAGTLTDVDVSKYSMTWVWWAPDINAEVFFIMGQGQYNTQAAAEAIEPSSLTLPPQISNEARLLYRIVWQRNGAVITRKSTADYRRQIGSPGSYVATDHRALTNLTWANGGHVGTAYYFAGFDADGEAVDIAPAQCFTFTVYDDGDWDNEVVPVWQAPKDRAVTIKQINSTVVGSSTPSLVFNLEERAWASLASAGTDVAADITADADGTETTVFTNAGIAAKAHLVFTTGSSAESGTVNLITVTVYYELA